MRKSIWILAGLVVVGLTVIGISNARADANVYDTATLQYKNLAGMQQPDTLSNWVLVSLRTPTLSLAKWLKVRRYESAYSQPQSGKYVVSGDSVTYKLIITNIGSDTANTVVLIDTQTFVDAIAGGCTLSFTLGPGGATVDYDTPTLGGAIQNGYGQVSNLEYLSAASVWTSAAFASWPVTEGAVRGIRWTLNYVAPQSVAGIVELYFTVELR
jgi:hypothetical protein